MNIIKVILKDKLEILNFEDKQIRMIVMGQIVWFVAKDISDILGYNQTSNMMKRIDVEDFISSKIGNMNMKSLLINESGLYQAVFGSKLETAKKFKRWVTSEVLPSIRQKGYYQQEKSDDEKLAEGILIANKKMLKLKEENKILEIENKELKEKSEYIDIILNSTSTMNVTQIAQDYGLSAIKFNQILKDLKIQYLINGQWILYGNYKNQGFISSKTIIIPHKNTNSETKLLTTWTQKGRLFLYHILKKNNILPKLEQ